MAQLNVFTVLLIIAAFNQATCLKISVYYESLCPDSIRFITKQLYPAYQNLDFDVELIPYGKAQHRTNPWGIRCQHGPNECLGNAVQACALERIDSQDDKVNFVNCVMSASYPPLFGDNCAESLNLTYTGVADCSTGDEGRELLTKLGDKTHSLQPALSFVPTIIFNDVYDNSIQNGALSNLPLTICTLYPDIAGCNIRIRPIRH